MPIAFVGLNPSFSEDGWSRNQVLMRRLREHGWGHVLFHGGVPGDRRGALVDRVV